MPQSCRFAPVIRCHNCANLHAMINELDDTLEGSNRARLVDYLEYVNFLRVDWEDGVTGADTLLIS